MAPYPDAPLSDYQEGPLPMPDAPAAEGPVEAPEIAAEADETEAPAKPTRRYRPPILDPDEIEDMTQSVLDDVARGRNERSVWMEKRLARYVKMRGWTGREQGPWEGYSDQHIPLIMANVLRTEAGLQNALMGKRPVVIGKPTDLKHQDTATRNDALLDYQMFVEGDGEAQMERFIQGFIEDGTVFSYQPRVCEQGELYDVRRVRRPSDEENFGLWGKDTIMRLAAEHNCSFEEVIQVDPEGYTWTGFYTRETDGVEIAVPINMYDGDPSTGDGRMEVVFKWPATHYDGPRMQVPELEEIIAPMRSENLQPVSTFNPTGSPWVVRVVKVPVNLVRDRYATGVYDLLTTEDLDAIEAVAEGRATPTKDGNDAIIKEQKDAQAGVAPETSGTGLEPGWVTVYEWFGKHPSQSCEVVLTVIADANVMARARYLSEGYPATPPTRPFAEARMIPVSGQLYGIGLVELMEGINDFLHELINDNVDAGRIASLPWFGYAASSGLKPQDLRLGPGDGVPLQNPQADLAFYQIPGRDQSWSFNMIGMAQQWLEKLVQQGALQMGQVPQGKASALRTVGTTMAILQQGAALPEQILRRLMRGICQVYEQFHWLNTRFLQPRKRFLVTGQPLGEDDAYAIINDRADINIPLVFDFQATMANTNKGMMAEVLEHMTQLVFSPIAIQSGAVTAEGVYNILRDMAVANQIDPDRYFKKPPEKGPIITVSGAIQSFAMGIPVQSTNFPHPAMQAVQELQVFFAGPQLGIIPMEMMPALKDWAGRVIQQAQQEQQQMMLMQAAQASGGAGGPKGKPGAPPGPGQPPEPQTEQGTQAEQSGADKSGGGQG